MSIFDIGIKILFFLTFIFFLVFAFLCRNWAKPKHPERCTIIGIFVSFLHTFWFFIAGLVILIIISLGWQYLPKLFVH